jgi:hypothetical protein
LGLDPRLARTVQPEDPWTYLKVIRALKRIERDGVDCVAEVDNGC